ncbi:hypothetical protein GW17_00054981 [Ensete ventricosum]|nr:hypothetical protein GW17_00054981 [Ensete ventricosum]
MLPEASLLLRSLFVCWGDDEIKKPSNEPSIPPFLLRSPLSKSSRSGRGLPAAPVPRGRRTEALSFLVSDLLTFGRLDLDSDPTSSSSSDSAAAPTRVVDRDRWQGAGGRSRREARGSSPSSDSPVSRRCGSRSALVSCLTFLLFFVVSLSFLVSDLLTFGRHDLDSDPTSSSSSDSAAAPTRVVDRDRWQGAGGRSRREARGSSP